MSIAPSLFISHGSPSFALSRDAAAQALQSFGSAQPKPTAVLVVSPHWQTHDLRVMSSARPDTIHDFGGFPAELHTLQYPAPGAPEIAAQVLALLQAAGLPAELDASRGRDHGAWVPLLHLLPAADVPVLQVSLPLRADAAYALAIGAALRPLRTAGIWVVGSGSLTHNLRELQAPGSAPAPHVQRFVAAIESALAADDRELLRDYRSRIEGAARAHPTEEHFLPLLVALGAAEADERAQRIAGGIDFGVLSMASYAFGAAAPAR
jgi:4,5-DOPA dioxygenase extradiol